MPRTPGPVISGEHVHGELFYIVYQMWASSGLAYILSGTNSSGKCLLETLFCFQLPQCLSLGKTAKAILFSAGVTTGQKKESLLEVIRFQLFKALWIVNSAFNCFHCWEQAVGVIYPEKAIVTKRE